MSELHLKAWREYVGMAQEECAEFLGLGQSAYSKLERGRLRLTIDKAQKLAEAFNITLTDLLEKEPPEKKVAG